MSLITSIQKYSIHDGDGIRTTVFFKGCLLKCVWCHNPETISGKSQIGIDTANRHPTIKNGVLDVEAVRWHVLIRQSMRRTVRL